MQAELEGAGYSEDRSFVLHDVKDETKSELLCYHSEKLAIAFGLMMRSSTTTSTAAAEEPLVIVKNLRVCGDCHHATKMIAKLRQCEIVVRDANRFHRFDKQGNCSCQDYF